VNLPLSVVPMPLTTVMITIEMPAAMRPYSIAGRARLVLGEASDKLHGHPPTERRVCVAPAC
jgi:hypothetical protein